MAQDIFAQAREEKRSVFGMHWDRFLRSKLLLALAVLLSCVQTVFFASCWEFVYATAFAVGALGQSHSVGCYFVVAGIQLLLCLPGWLYVAAVWKLRKTGFFGDGQKVNLQGVRLLRLTNTGVCIFGAIAVAAYPTVIITAGDYVSASRLEHIFYLFLAMTFVFLLCVSFVRVVLRGLEENVSCGWSGDKFLLLLILSCVVGALAIGAWIGEKLLFHYVAIALLLTYAALLTAYAMVLHRIRTAQEKIDAAAIASKKPLYDDPYNRI